MTAPLQWTPERLEMAKTRWLDGDSGQVIADALGKPFSRSAVIGQAFRRQWTRRPGLEINGVHGSLGEVTRRREEQRAEARLKREFVAAAKIRTVKPVVQRAPSPPRPIAEPPPVVCLDHARPFMSRASRECAWMLDDGRSCCGPVSRGSYCAGHAAQVYRPVKALDGEKMARKFG